MAVGQGLLRRGKIGWYFFVIFFACLVQRNVSFTINLSHNHLKNVAVHLNKPGDYMRTKKSFSSKDLLFSCARDEEEGIIHHYPLRKAFKRNTLNFFKILRAFVFQRKYSVALTTLACLMISSIGTNKLAHAATSVSKHSNSKSDDVLPVPRLISSTSGSVKQTNSARSQSTVKSSNKESKGMKKLTFALLGTTAGLYLGNRVISSMDKERNDENEKKFNKVMSLSDDKIAKVPPSLIFKEPLVAEPLSSTEAMERTKAAEQASFSAAAEKAKAASTQAMKKKASTIEKGKETIKIANFEKDKMEVEAMENEVSEVELRESKFREVQKKKIEHRSMTEDDNSGKTMEKLKLETELTSKDAFSSEEEHPEKEISITPEEHPLTKEEKEKILTEKYASMSLEERAFAILVDLGMVDLTPDPDDPSYDNTLDDEYWTENVWE